MNSVERQRLYSLCLRPGVLLALALTLLALLAWQFQRNQLALAESDRWETHTYEVLLQLDGLYSLMQDARVGQRGFLLTGSADYLQPYNRAQEEIQQRLARLKSLTRDNPHQLERLQVLDSLIGAKLALLKQAIELRRTEGVEAATRLVQTGRGQSLMDQIREQVAAAQQEESRLLELRTTTKQRQTRRTTELAAVEVVLCGGLLVLAFLLLERQKAASRASEIRYRRLFEAAMDGVLLLDPVSRRIQDANPFMTQLLGYPRAELVGKELWQIGLLKDAESSRTAFDQLSAKGYIRYEDLPLQVRSGEAREVEFVSNVYEEDGRAVIQCNVRDITLRKRAEEALRKSKERYRTLFNSIDEGFCIVEVLFDPRGQPIDYLFLEINPSFERQSGLTDACGKNMRELAPEHEEYWFELYGKIALTGQPMRFQSLAAQLHRWFDVYAFRVGEPEERHVAILFQDITGRRQAEHALEATLAREQAARQEAELSRARLQAANRELDDFATIVSHDLKAPLRGVSTLAKWLQSDYADKLDEEGRENLADMVKRVGRMDRMIDGILQYSRLGRTEEKPEPVALNELVPTVVDDLAPPPHVRVHIAAGLPLVHGEPIRLRQVFQNLLGNAIKYGNKSPLDIRVDWADVGGAWEIGVADNGPGIEGRHFERIFKIFQTLAPKDRTDSTGVGLALVRRIVEQAGGRVRVESRLGEGSAFRFTWPKGPRANAAELPEKVAA